MYAYRYESLIPGKPELVAEYKGKLFCFSTEANQEKFLRCSNREITVCVCHYKTECLYFHIIHISVSAMQIVIYFSPFASLFNMYVIKLDLRIIHNSSSFVCSNYITNCYYYETASCQRMFPAGSQTSMM